MVASHGTTTVVADPHEIANVAGAEGIEYMLACRTGAPVDILYMLPSCVPATPLDIGSTALDAEALAVFGGREGILGLGEMMNVPGYSRETRQSSENLRSRISATATHRSSPGWN